MSKLFEALQQLELETDGVSANFNSEAQALLQQPVPEGQAAAVGEPAPGVDGLPFAPRVVPVRVASDSPLMPFEPNFANVGEQYRIIRTKIVQHPMSPRVVAISSVDPGDGKTTTAVNVAAALALKTETKVLLVDCDLRRGQIGSVLGLPSQAGLTDVLSGKAQLNDSIIQIQQFPNLCVLTAGASLANPAEVLDSVHWRLLIDQLRKYFDYVILDTPPLGVVADSDLIHQVADGLILVVRPDYTTRSRCLSVLATMSEKGILGVVLNGVPKPHWGEDNASSSYYHYSPTNSGS